VHAVHVDPSLPEYPGLHLQSATASLPAALSELAGQLVHADPVQYWLAGHPVEHDADPAAEVWPVGQSAHAVAPEVAVYLLATQSVHAVDAMPEAYLPGAHGVHDAVPVTEV